MSWLKWTVAATQEGRVGPILQRSTMPREGDACCHFCFVFLPLVAATATKSELEACCQKSRGRGQALDQEASLTGLQLARR